MKLQPASRREVARIAIGTACCAVLMVAGLYILSLLGVGIFSYRVIIGAVGGSCIAVVNFALLCLMVQKAADTDDEKLRKAKVQASYHLRRMLQILWGVAAFLIPFIHFVAAVIPLIFPTVVIFFLQATGRLLPADSNPAATVRPAADEEEEENEQDLGPFEV